MVFYLALTIQELIDMFIASRVSYCAEASIEYYQDCLTLFGSFLSSRGFSSPRDLTKQLLSDYSVYLRDGRQIKATSIHTNFRAINAFIAWMIEEDYMEEFRYHIKLPRQNPEIVLPLSGAEVQVLLDTIKKRSSDPIRDVCIFRLMLDCGLRSSEVRNLRVKDVHPDKILTVCNSKFNKSRVLPVPDRVQPLLLYQIRGKRSSDFVFSSKTGLKLTENSIKLFFSKLKDRSGVYRVHAHLLRHTFATSYMMRHNNIEYLRIYMGHSSYQVTQRYVHLASQCLLTRYDVYQISSVFL